MTPDLIYFRALAASEKELRTAYRKAVQCQAILVLRAIILKRRQMAAVALFGSEWQ